MFFSLLSYFSLILMAWLVINLVDVLSHQVLLLALDFVLRQRFLYFLYQQMLMEPSDFCCLAQFLFAIHICQWNNLSEYAVECRIINNHRNHFCNHFCNSIHQLTQAFSSLHLLSFSFHMISLCLHLVPLSVAAVVG